jgi:hypothetical protein
MVYILQEILDEGSIICGVYSNLLDGKNAALSIASDKPEVTMDACWELKEWCTSLQEEKRSWWWSRYPLDPKPPMYPKCYNGWDRLVWNSSSQGLWMNGYDGQEAAS